MSRFLEARLDRWFGFRALGSNLRTEITAGLTTFAAMAYILAVNPATLSDTGMDTGAVISATALASALMTAVMALATNYPIALAPGMGINAFFTYTICVGLKMPWTAALAMVFCSGALFLLITITGLRRKLIEAIPPDLKIAISCGIGLFIAFIGLQKAGVVRSHAATLVTAGDLGSPPTVLALAGVLLTGVLVWRRVRGAILLAIVALTLAGFLVPAADGQGALTRWPERLVDWPASLAPTFLRLDLGYLWENLARTLPLILSLLFVDLFDNMGTLIGVCQRSGLLDAQGNLPRMGRALAADATAAMVGSCLGTSTVTSYIESAAGVEEGGRTGLSSLVVAVCFLLALFFHPLIRMVPPVATAPALIIVGVFMMQGMTRLNLNEFSQALPAILIIILMPLTFSISEGLAIGFLVYVLMMVGIGRFRQVSWIAYLLAGLFLLHFLLR
jgi:AGZA family xanthine/uracil permease-like MFS transporter